MPGPPAGFKTWCSVSRIQLLSYCTWLESIFHGLLCIVSMGIKISNAEIIVIGTCVLFEAQLFVQGLCVDVAGVGLQHDPFSGGGSGEVLCGGYQGPAHTAVAVIFAHIQIVQYPGAFHAYRCKKGIELCESYRAAFVEGQIDHAFAVARSEERRVGKEGRSRWSPY